MTDQTDRPPEKQAAQRYCWRCATPLEGRPPTACSKCGQSHFNNPKPAGMAVVERDGSVLLIRRAHDPWRGCWDIPGGFCDPGEHPIHTAERELLEETGWRGRAIALIGIWVDSYGTPDADGLQEMTLNIAYLAGLVDKHRAQQPDNEALESRWFAIDDLPTQLAFPGHIPAVLRTAREVLVARDLPPLLDGPR